MLTAVTRTSSREFLILMASVNAFSSKGLITTSLPLRIMTPVSGSILTFSVPGTCFTNTTICTTCTSQSFFQMGLAAGTAHTVLTDFFDALPESMLQLAHSKKERLCGFIRKALFVMQKKQNLAGICLQTAVLYFLSQASLHFVTRRAVYHHNF